MSPALFYDAVSAVALLFGLCIGSFLNVCIARMPENRSVAWPPSHCPSCGHNIRPRDNVPVLSWLVLRGRCRDCGTRISALYPTIELLTGLLAWVLFRRLVPGFGDLDPAHAANYAFYLAFVAMLIAVTYIDIRHYIVPDEFSIYAVPLGVAGAALARWLGGAGPTWQQSVLGALVGGGSLIAVRTLYWLVRREEGMGMGDVKLLAMIGAWLGVVAIPLVILIASFSGAVVGITLLITQRKGLRAAVPFGPFLAFGALVWLLHGEQIVMRYFPGVEMWIGRG